MRIRRRAALCVIASLAIVCIVTAACLTAIESRHECTGADCPVCAVLSVCVDLLNNLCAGTALVCSGFSAYRVVRAELIREGIYTRMSPVNRGDRLLN